MPKAISIDSQTEFADSLLAELAQLATDPEVNFNSTKQFDSLLRHLETSLAAPAFAVVPSIEILHILFTLCTRTAASNWSHDSLHAFAGDTSQYMRHVNRAYDSTLHKPSLQQRSAAILKQYLGVLACSGKTPKPQTGNSTQPHKRAPAGADTSADDVSGKHNGLHGASTSDSALNTLLSRVEDVLAAFSCPEIASFFADNSAVSLSPTKSAQPRLNRLHGGRRAKKKAQQMINEIEAEDAQHLGIDVPAPVEIISDSGDSEIDTTSAPLPSSEADPYPKLNELSFAAGSMPSFFDLGANVSGLGESAALFQSMPHLLKSETPSSDAEPEPDTANEDAPARKRRKKSAPLGVSWRRILVFDDHVISRKLSASSAYDVWSFLRWTFWCAESSAQYQKFLFDASSTHVHHTYAAGRDFFLVFFGLCHVQLRRWAEASCGRPAVISHHLLALGPRHEWPERAINHVFAGLGVPSNDKPYPCYEREVHLTKNDATVLNSRCKTATENDDNMDSMRLRVHMIYLLLDFEYIKVHGKRSLTVGRRPATISLGFLTLPSLIVPKLAMLPLAYIECFFRTLVSEIDVCVGRSVIMQDASVPTQLACFLCLGLINDITGMKHSFKEAGNGADEADLLVQVADLLTYPQLYRSLVDDVTFKCIEDFVVQWKKLMFVAEWLFGLVLSDAQPWQKQVILKKAEIADQLASSGYEEFIHSRSELSDLLLDTTFTLTADQVKQFSSQWQSGFSDLAQFKLMLQLAKDAPQKIFKLKPTEDTIQVYRHQQPTYYKRQTYTEPVVVTDFEEISSTPDSEVEIIQNIPVSRPIFEPEETILDSRQVVDAGFKKTIEEPPSAVQQEISLVQASEETESISDGSSSVSSSESIANEPQQTAIEDIETEETPVISETSAEVCVPQTPTDSDATVDEKHRISQSPVESDATVDENQSVSQSPINTDATVDKEQTESPNTSGNVSNAHDEVKKDMGKADVHTTSAIYTDRSTESTELTESAESNSEVDDTCNPQDASSEWDEFQSFTDGQPEINGDQTTRDFSSTSPNTEISKDTKPKLDSRSLDQTNSEVKLQGPRDTNFGVESHDPKDSNPEEDVPFLKRTDTELDLQCAKETNPEVDLQDSKEKKSEGDSLGSNGSTSGVALSSSKETILGVDIQNGIHTAATAGVTSAQSEKPSRGQTPPKVTQSKLESDAALRTPVTKVRLIKSEHSGRKSAGRKRGVVSKPKFDIIHMLMNSSRKPDSKESVANIESKDVKGINSGTNSESKAESNSSVVHTEPNMPRTNVIPELKPNSTACGSNVHLKQTTDAKQDVSGSEQVSDETNEANSRENGSPVQTSRNVDETPLSGPSHISSAEFEPPGAAASQEPEVMDSMPLSMLRKRERDSLDEVPLSQLCRN